MEGRALVGLALRPDPAAHPLGQALADGQAEPGATVAAIRGGVHLAERLEEAVEAVGGDADAGVPDHEVQLVTPRRDLEGLHGDADLARLRELHRVAQEIDQHLSHARGVPPQPDRGSVLEEVGELEALLACPGRDELERVLDALAQVERGLLQLQHAGFDLREVQDVVDEREEMIAAGADGLGELPLLGVQAGVHHQGRHADDGVQRGPDLVTHVGQELGLRLGGRLRRRLRALQLGLHDLALDELADLVAHRLEHPQEILVGVPELRAEELHHAEESARADHGKPERPVQPVLGRARPTGEVRIPLHVHDPRGVPRRPDPARQAHAPRERRGPTLVGQRVSAGGRPDPRLAAPEHLLLGVETPLDREAPVETPADRLQDPGQRVGERRGLGEDRRRRVLRHQPVLAGLALRVHAIQESGRRPDEDGEQQDGERDREGQAQLGRQESPTIEQELQPSEHERNDHRGGQEPAREGPARLIGGHHRDEAPLRAGPERAEGEREEGDRGRQRHRDEAGDAVQLADAVHVAEERGRGDRDGHEQDELGGPGSAAALPVEQRQRDAEEQEIDAGVWRDPVVAQPGAPQQLVQPEVFAHDVSGDRDGAHERDQARRDPRPPAGPPRTGRPGQTPERARGQHERQRGRGIHGHVSGQQGAQARHVELPPEQRAGADQPREDTGRPRGRPEQGLARPGHGPATVGAPPRTSQARTRARTNGGLKGLIR